MGMLSRGNATFAEGREFEETFPDATTPQTEPQAPAPVAARRLTVVRDEVRAEPAVESPEPQVVSAPPVLSAERFDELVLRIDQALQAALDQRIEQRLA